MPKFIVESTHAEEDCLKAMDAFVQYGHGYLTQAEWGCPADHRAWIAIEANTAAEARNVVPPALRKSVKVVPVMTLTADDIRKLQAAHSADVTRK